ncbi:MAG: hypothetical protein U0441_11995 [Polyangiaceae bacterium]
MLDAADDAALARKDEPHLSTNPAIATDIAPPRMLALSGGGRVDAERDAGGVDTVHVRDRSGVCVLRIRMTDEGPVLTLAGARLEIEASRSMTLRSEELHIQAGRARLDVTGDLEERVAGTVQRHALGDVDVRARRLRMKAMEGDAILEANDDVTLRGERVRLNSDDPPMPLTLAEFEARRRAAAGGVG